jgi:formylglycine-generating enzyme required for sulfatase activity
MVWCNALTDYVNAETGTAMTYCYYTGIDLTVPILSCDSSGTTPDTDGSQDAPFINDNTTGFRLPYANEWECAADTVYNASPSAGQIDSEDVAVFVLNSGLSTAGTKTKLPNALGLYDMSGNVFEWCFDWAEGFTGTKRGKRGGSWYDTSELLQIGYRNVGSEPWMNSDDFGIRIVKN